MPSEQVVPRGRKAGPKLKLSPSQEDAALAMYEGEENIPVYRIALAFGITKPTLYTAMQRARERRPGSRQRGAADSVPSQERPEGTR